MAQAGGKKGRRNRKARPPRRAETRRDSGVKHLHIPAVKAPAWQGGLAAFMLAALLFLLLAGLEALKEMAASLPAVP